MDKNKFGGFSKMKKINKVQEKNYSWENANKREEKEKVEKGRTIN